MNDDLRYALRVAQWQHTSEWIDEAFQVASRAKIMRGNLVLDVGTNTGRMMHFMSDLFDAIPFGVETNPEAVAIARMQLKSPSLIVPTIEEAARMVSGGFDAVILSHVLGHVPKPFEMLRQAIGVCRPGGIVVLAVPNPTYDWLMTPMNALTGYQSDPTLIHTLTRADLIAAVDAEIVHPPEVFYMGSGPNWIPASTAFPRLRSRLGIAFTRKLL